MKETKFKNTEIGKIPEEWRICNFGSPDKLGGLSI